MVFGSSDGKRAGPTCQFGGLVWLDLARSGWPALCRRADSRSGPEDRFVPGRGQNLLASSGLARGSPGKAHGPTGWLAQR
jgi:hypothetical protein